MGRVVEFGSRTDAPLPGPRLFGDSCHRIVGVYSRLFVLLSLKVEEVDISAYDLTLICPSFIAGSIQNWNRFLTNTAVYPCVAVCEHGRKRGDFGP